MEKSDPGANVGGRNSVARLCHSLAPLVELIKSVIPSCRINFGFHLRLTRVSRQGQTLDIDFKAGSVADLSTE
jgi:hypothetical protein